MRIPISGAATPSSISSLPRSTEISCYIANDPTAYAFMLPTSIAVATSCQLSGIGGAALFSPIFLLAFPLLGPDYPLDSAAAAIASALLTEVFGFSSGLYGYARRGLVAWPATIKFVRYSVPLAVVGALCASYVASSPEILRGIYSALMFALAGYLTFAAPPAQIAAEAADECEVGDSDRLLTTTATDGRSFSYFPPKLGPASIGVTSVGSFLTGVLGVGVGEVLLPQLVRSCCMPVPLAAGTSVATVVCTAAAAAIVQFGALAALVGGDIASVIPWRLVQWTIPGVLIGGQLAPLIASRGLVEDEVIERFAAVLFALVGLSFLVAST